MHVWWIRGKNAPYNIICCVKCNIRYVDEYENNIYNIICCMIV
jgi:hypothetical protein